MCSIKNKIIAIMLIMVICVGNFAFVLENISTTYATNTNLEAQSIATNNENVEFDTYFMKEAQKVHTFSQNMVDKATFYIDIDVKKTGYLKEATIEIDANFKVDENYNQEGILKIENNKIELNQINGNSDKTTIALPIYFDVSKKVNISDFSRQNEATIKATYIDDEAKEHKIEKTIVNKLIWVANPEVQMEEKIEKYAPYNTEEHTGIIVEQRINAQIKDGVLPIAESNIEITVPKIQNIMPQINIRKEGNTNLLENEWTYNKETGKLIIKETNLPNEQGQIDWITKEEYIITYRFENASMQEEQTFTTKASSNIQVYNGETKNLTAKMQKENKLTETIGQIIEINTKINEEKLSKGYLYTNLENTEKLEIPFTTNYAINISYKDVADQIILNTNQEQWNMQNQKELVNTYIKNISITRENFKNILGEEGSIVILANNKEIAKVTLPNEETDEIKLDLSEHNLSAITIKVSRPQTEGILNITANKAIKQANTMTKEQIQNISKLETSANIQVIKKENTIMQDAKTAEVTVVEPTSKINVQISKNQLSTVVEKEEVEIKATLKTNSEYDSLYKNPTIDIKLPTEIQNVEILGVELLYEEELKIRNTQLIDGTNKIIRVELTGNQTKYSQNEISTGATVVIRANITLDNLTPTKTEKIEVIYTNQKSTQYENATAEGTGINQIQIKYIAPTGLVPVNTISNYAENKQTRSIAGSNEQGMLEVSSEARIATSEIQLINNYNNKINNIRILGRTLTTGTTDIATNTDLKNTFDAIMVNEIVSEQISQDKYTVYYSENGKATQDLENTENAWTTQPENLSNVKSYLIVLSDYEMNTGDSIKFGYQMQIPEGLNYNEKVSSVYTVYFDNIQEEQTIQDTLLASGLSLTTGEAPELEVALESYTQENTKVREGQYVKYKAKLKNTGSMDAQNVSINVSAPSGNIYYYIENGKINYVDNLNGKEGKQVATYKTKHTQFVEEDFACEYEDQEEINKNIAVGTLKAGESKEIEYELKIEEFELIKKNLPAENGKLVSPEVKMSSKVEVIADKMKKPITSNEYTVVLDEGKIQVEASSEVSNDIHCTE